MEYSATSQTPVYMGHKKGWTKTRRGKECHWSTWECHMIKSFRLDLRSAPTDRPVDKSSFFAVHIYRFPRFLNTCHLGIKESTSCRYVQYFIIKSCVQINLEVSCSLHNKSWWQPLVQRTPASQGTLVFYEHCFNKEGKYHWVTVCWTLDIQENNRNTPGCIFPSF